MSNKSSGKPEGADAGTKNAKRSETEGEDLAEARAEAEDEDDEDSEDEDDEDSEDEDDEDSEDEDDEDSEDEDDEDDDSEDEDADEKDSGDEEDEPDSRPIVDRKMPATTKGSRKSEQGARHSTRRAKPAPSVLTEQEIDSPSRQTIGMLGVVAAATLVMWGVGRAECNYNEIGEGMKPRELSLEERTRTPKDLAFAFQHALSSYDFATAAKLATGDAKKLVETRKGQCKPNCDAKREELKGKVKTVSELLKRTASHALTRVWSDGGDSKQKHLAVLSREGRDWRVESYSVDDGHEVSLPGEMPPNPRPMIPEPTGSASAASPSPGAPTPAMPPGHPPIGGVRPSPSHAPMPHGYAAQPMPKRPAQAPTPGMPRPPAPASSK